MMKRGRSAFSHLLGMLNSIKIHRQARFLIFWGLSFLFVIFLANWYLFHTSMVGYHRYGLLQEKLKKIIDEHMSVEEMKSYIEDKTKKMINRSMNVIKANDGFVNDEVKEAVKDDVRSERFEKDGFLEDIYFFLYSCTNPGEVVAHGADQDLEGQVLWDRQDSTGEYVIQKLHRTACCPQQQENCEGGFFEYKWPRPSDIKGLEYSKIAYVQAIDELGWWIGTGFYDVDANVVLALEAVQEHGLKNHQRNQQALWITAGISIFAGLLLISVANHRASALKTKLTEQERFAAQLWHSSEDGLVVTDAQGEIIAANAHARDMFRYPATELVGRPLNDLLPQGWQEDYAIKMSEVIDQGTTFRHPNLPRLRKDGTEIRIDVVMAPVIADNGAIKSRIHAIRDVTEAHHRVAEIERINRELEKVNQELAAVNQELAAVNQELQEALATAQRLQFDLIRVSEQATIGRFVAGIIHEFRQPVASIRLAVDNSRECLDDPPPNLTCGLQIIEEMVEELSEKLRSIQQFARSRNGVKHPFYADQAVDTIVTFKNTEFRRHNVRVERKFAAHGRKIYGEEKLLQLVLCSIIDNALEAMEQSHNKELTIETQAQHQTVEIRITDTGPGIEPSRLAQIFQPDSSTKDQQNTGRGQGLYLCREILREDFDGTLRAENGEGGGAVFIITLKQIDPHTDLDAMA